MGLAFGYDISVKNKDFFRQCLFLKTMALPVVANETSDNVLEGDKETFNNLQYVTPVFLPSNKVNSEDSKCGESEKARVPSVCVIENDSEYSEDGDDDFHDDSLSDIVETGKTSSEKRLEDLPEKKRPAWLKYRGMMLAILSSLIFTVSALLVKTLETYDPYNSALYKFQGALIPSIALFLQKLYCSKKGAAVVERVWPLTESKKLKTFGLVLLRSFLTCNALLLHFFSLKYLPMGDALTIASASPIFVAILARIFLGEKCGYSTFIASVVSMLGVVAIAKPPMLSGSSKIDMPTLIGSSMAFGCTIMSAVIFVVLRHIRKVHYSVTTLAYGGLGSFESLILVLLIPGLRIPSEPNEWFLITGLALLTLLGQMTLIVAMKSEQVGTVVLIRTLDVLFAYIFEISILGTIPDLWSIIGAAVIVLSIAFVGLRKWVRSFPRGHPVRRKLRFISL